MSDYYQVKPHLLTSIIPKQGQGKAVSCRSVIYSPIPA